MYAEYLSVEDHVTKVLRDLDVAGASAMNSVTIRVKRDRRGKVRAHGTATVRIDAWSYDKDSLDKF